MKAFRRDEEICVRRWERIALVRDDAGALDKLWVGVGRVVDTSVCTKTRFSIVVYT